MLYRLENYVATANYLGVFIAGNCSGDLAYFPGVKGTTRSKEFVFLAKGGI